jgi:type IV secretory pathway VirB2 component (pilin)
MDKETLAIGGVIVLGLGAMVTGQDGVVLGGIIALLGSVFGAHILKTVNKS